MRSTIIAALVSLALLAQPARAQLFPTTAPSATEPAPAPAASTTPADQTLVDATLYVEPPTQQGLCLGIGAGQVTVTVRRVADAVVEPRPAKFSLLGLMVDPDTRIESPVSGQETTTTTHIKGSDRYCWSVAINAPETNTMSHAQRGGYVQTVAVRIIFRPD